MMVQTPETAPLRPLFSQKWVADEWWFGFFEVLEGMNLRFLFLLSYLCFLVVCFVCFVGV